MKSLSVMVQKLWRRLKLTTDKQTDRHTAKQTDRTKTIRAQICQSGRIEMSAKAQLR